MTSIDKNNSETFSLMDLIYTKIFLNEKKIGKISDFIIIDEDKIAEVTHVCVDRPFGHQKLFIPFSKVIYFSSQKIDIDVSNVEEYATDITKEKILLKDHILDKKIIDTEYREVELVYDVKLVLKNKRLYVTEVDISKYQLLRRLGLGFLSKFLFNRIKDKDETIQWAYIQPLPSTIGSFSGDIQLKILKETLSDMPPVDLADILEELEPSQRAMIFEKLDIEQASDTLEEIDPNVQRDLVSSLKKDKIAPLINEMTPGQAADILSVLASSDAKAILELLTNKENALKIKSILDQQEEKILDFSISKCVSFGLNTTVKEAKEQYQDVAKDKDVIMYIYVIDKANTLLGVIDIKELLKAKNEEFLQDIMTSHIVSLDPDSTLHDASVMFARYGFRALPITDDNNKFMGVIPYRDVMNLKHLFL